jgi:Ca2+-binding RTX toxin-like protein
MADTTLAIPQEITDLPSVERRATPVKVITGTDGGDIIATTAQDDIVNALAGNDIIKGSKGNDLINGGLGIDTVDYSALGGPVRLGAAGKVFKGKGGDFGTDQLIGIETIVGSKGAGDTIDGSTATSGTVPINVDLSQQTLSVIGVPGLGTLNFIVKNFEDVIGTGADDIIAGDIQDNNLSGGAGNDLIIGSKGNDIIDGGDGIDTVDYSALGGPIRLGAAGKVSKGKDGKFGTDELRMGIEIIVASKGAGDTIDGSLVPAGDPARYEVDLFNQTFSILDIPGAPRPLNLTVKNFEDVTGTHNDDKIAGDLQNNKLNGGDGNDILTGTTGSFGGSTEVDTLTGGDGDDIFVLGRGDTLFYSGNRNADFAKITDFGNGADQIFLANGKYDFIDDELFAIKANGSRDLIAKIDFAQGSSSNSQRQASTVALSDATVNPLLTNTTFSLSQGQSFGIFTASVV